MWKNFLNVRPNKPPSPKKKRKPQTEESRRKSQQKYEKEKRVRKFCDSWNTGRAYHFCFNFKMCDYGHCPVCVI